MNDEQVERILAELVTTRKSFDAAIGQIRWNRINTAIQYVLLALVVIMFSLGTRYYLDEKRATCERGNELRLSIVDSLDSNAAAIGLALVIVTDASEESFKEYMDAYNQQEPPPALGVRDC